MSKYKTKLSFATLAALLIAVTLFAVASAGSVYDYGQIIGLPAQANYVAWIETGSNPPSQVTTEDGYNSGLGINQGYKSLYWRLAPTQLDPPPVPGAQIKIIFGGMSTDYGKIWNFSYNWTNAIEYTNHGTVGTLTTNAGCPRITYSYWDGATKTINWSGAQGRYFIYRSLNASGAGNRASNGRYNYMATVDTTGPTGSYVENVSVPNWHIIVPADQGTNAIVGCHSEESTPTAVTLKDFRLSSSSSPIWLVALSLGAILLASLVVFMVRRPARR